MFFSSSATRNTVSTSSVNDLNFSFCDFPADTASEKAEIFLFPCSFSGNKLKTSFQALCSSIFEMLSYYTFTFYFSILSLQRNGEHLIVVVVASSFPAADQPKK
mmetsp:Transcript_1773/g.2276  ORF Transcript_1773/g.2276 Transcript_1773/m.2276 type:complete len:104 (+) Transcript_1773:1080-1391(+)